jgi:hypothetical protein
MELRCGKHWGVLMHLHVLYRVLFHSEGPCSWGNQLTVATARHHQHVGHILSRQMDLIMGIVCL